MNWATTLGLLSSVVQASSDLLLGQVGKLLLDFLGILASRKIAEYEANRNPCSFNPRFTPTHIGGAYDMPSPLCLHDATFFRMIALFDGFSHAAFIFKITVEQPQ